jgi:putative ABC transport system permease protein
VSAIGRSRGAGVPQRQDPGGGVRAASRLAAPTDLPRRSAATLGERYLAERGDGRYPAVVLGCAAAPAGHRLPAGRAGVLGGEWFTVVGMLDPVPLAPELDRAALVGWPAADVPGFDGHRRPSTPAREDAVEAVAAVLAADGEPAGARTRSKVSRPSDALAAQAATTARSPGCCSGSGAWRCWSAGSAWRTRW